MRLKVKISLMVTLPLVAVLIISTAVTLGGQHALDKVTREVADLQMHREVTEQVKTLHALCDGQHKVIMEKLRNDVVLAGEVMEGIGAPRLAAGETVRWQAVNQFSKAEHPVDMPRFLLGEQWLGQVSGFDEQVPLVDRVMKLTGSTCTVFQRMPDSDDFLRVATNVEKLDGSRAIGTYLPARNPDGAANAVVSTVLEGRAFEGLAFVVNDWYLTKYVPIEADGEVIGILYVGVKQDLGNLVRETIRKLVVGKTGYAFVYSTHPSSKGVWLIGATEQDDGKNNWEVKDADGGYVVQDLVAAAQEARAENGEGAAGYVKYRWQNAGETEPREKVTAVVQFAPWHWVICAGAYTEDFLDGKKATDEEMSAIVWETIVIGLLALIIALALSYRFLLRITGNIAGIQSGLAGLADGDLTVRVDCTSGDEIAEMADALNRTVAGLHEIVVQIRSAADTTAASGEELAASAQSISTGSQQQASSAEEISSSMQGMTVTVQEVADHAGHASKLCIDTMTMTEQGNRTVGESIEGMRLINDSSMKISKITDVIGQIANQTNLLALNAAIEAASAGDHGQGFAVVAEEVRKLAERASSAAEESSSRVGQGMRLSEEVGEVLTRILAGIKETVGGMEQITSGTDEQAHSAEQIASAIEGISAITEESSASAEEMAASSEDLAAQAQQLQGLVSNFTLDDARQRRSAEPPTKTPPAKAITRQADEGDRPAGGAGALYHD